MAPSRGDRPRAFPWLLERAPQARPHLVWLFGTFSERDRILPLAIQQLLYVIFPSHVRW